MKTYGRTYEDTGFNGKELAGYVCKENPSIMIKIERGALSHNRPTGFTVLVNGTTDYTKGLASYLTLAEAKMAAEEL